MFVTQSWSIRQVDANYVKRPIRNFVRVSHCERLPMNKPEKVATPQVLKELRELVAEEGGDPAIESIIEVMRLGPGGRPLSQLEEFTFNQYSSFICSKNNWPLFEPLFDARRDLILSDFKRINELRNIVFHFRRGITPKDTDRLRRFRDKLRYDRELYAKRQPPETA